ncbi:DUF4352 domain-containing protein [Clostridium perfringens]|uniref:DUF4352 domain-containing protein n=1 Tax=Clostridium perfringens TaxID=1502 RepID=UPI001ABB9FEE|nr:DUF4352 domain-containing protein [Clostridium perfringens]MBO3312105.1 DUF4352 domain-containing protein [Clostridium perfringens]MDM0717657.1 DUF4352 domain-containing protein [Clostridium perfringens]MDM0867290.1 DUF4352 domain-containing protein [Clostridium perfringens]MDO6232501.1 DUF4352 domain-containing protein [Clostridium perfringens]MDU4602995.1 DUF4352 domain-containing protein [Clostridium perfringens]
MKNKKQIIINIVIAIVFFFLGGIVGSRAEYSRLTSIQNVIHNNSANERVKKENKKEETKVIPLNQEENLGNIGLKVLSVNETEQVNNKSGSTSSSGKFIVIELSLKNNAKQAVEYNPNQLELLANDGVVYQVDDVAFQAGQNLNSQETIYNKNKDFIGFYDKFNSGLTKNTYVVFDVPKDLNIDNTNLVIEGIKGVQFSLK